MLYKIKPKVSLDKAIYEKINANYNWDLNSKYLYWECFSHPNLDKHQCNPLALSAGGVKCRYCNNSPLNICKVTCHVSKFCLAVFAYRLGIGGENLNTAVDKNLKIGYKSLIQQVGTLINRSVVEEDNKSEKSDKETNLYAVDEEKEEELISITEAARLYECSYCNMHSKVTNGKLSKVELNRKMYVKKSDVLDLKLKKGRKMCEVKPPGGGSSTEDLNKDVNENVENGTVSQQENNEVEVSQPVVSSSDDSNVETTVAATTPAAPPPAKPLVIDAPRSTEAPVAPPVAPPVEADLNEEKSSLMTEIPLADQDLITVKEAAELYGCSAPNIHVHINKGNLKKTQVGSRIYVHRDEVLARKEKKISGSQRKVERKKKEKGPLFDEDGVRLYTVTEAAGFYGCSYYNMYAHVKNNNVQNTERDGKKYLREDDILKLKETHGRKKSVVEPSIEVTSEPTVSEPVTIEPIEERDGTSSDESLAENSFGADNTSVESSAE